MMPGETVGRDELSTSSHTIRSTPDPLSSVAQVSDPEGDKRAETGDESPSSPGGASVNAPQCWGEQIRNAFPDIQGAESARCVHGFIRGKGHLKNKFCTRCREGFDVPASQCRALAPGELSAVFRNYSGVGLWARTPPQYGEKRFRLVNQTKQCGGPRIAIFVEKPPDIESERSRAHGSRAPQSARHRSSASSSRAVRSCQPPPSHGRSACSSTRSSNEQRRENGTVSWARRRRPAHHPWDRRR